MKKILIYLFFLITTNCLSQDYQPVLVKWVDIKATDGGWRTPDEMLEWSVTQQDTVTQIGFIVHEDNTKLILTDAYFKNEDLIGYCVSIPKTTRFLKTKYPMTNQTFGKLRKISKGMLISKSCWKNKTIRAVSRIPRIPATAVMAILANAIIAPTLITVIKNFIFYWGDKGGVSLSSSLIIPNSNNKVRIKSNTTKINNRGTSKIVQAIRIPIP